MPYKLKRFRCNQCESSFEANTIERRFCSRDCYYKYSSINGNSGQFTKETTKENHPHWKGGKIHISVCGFCKIYFTAYKSSHRKFCSVECFREHWIKQEYHKQRNKITFQKISKALRGKGRPDLSGDKHPNWKGGRSRGYKTGYYSTEYKKWREKVFERDNYFCQECSSDNYITAHHIKSFAHYPELRFNVENGLTLCEKCHTKTDNYKGKNKKAIPNLVAIRTL